METPSRADTAWRAAPTGLKRTRGSWSAKPLQAPPAPLSRSPRTTHPTRKLKFLHLELSWTRSPLDQKLPFSCKANTSQRVLIWRNLLSSRSHQCQSHFSSLSDSAPTSVFSPFHRPPNAHPWLCLSPLPLFLQPRKSSTAPTVSITSTWRYGGGNGQKNRTAAA